MMGAMAFALVSCSSEADIAVEPDRNESYTRDFIKDFGVPAAGHTWSEATSTTLTIKSDAGTHVRVCYEEGGTLYLVGDLSVPAGSTDVPFIVPNNVSELKVEAYGETFTAKVGSTLDLSAELSKASSRSDGFAAPMTTASSRASDDEYPIENAIRFKTEMLKAWDDVFKRNTNNLFLDPSKITTGTVSYTNNSFHAINEKTHTSTKTWCYLVEYNLRTEGYKWSDISWDGMNTSNSELNPGCFKYSYGYSAYTENSDISSTATTSNINTPYGLDSYTVQYLSTGSYAPELLFKDKPSSYVTRKNLWGWDKNGHAFWNVDGYHINRAYFGAVAYMPNEPVTFKVYRNGQWEERTRPAIFLGYNAPAKLNSHDLGIALGDNNLPDFCDVVFMLVPENEGDAMYMGYSGATGGTSTGQFILATEDLGGSHDWDFNDAVFNVSCVTRSVSDIMLDDIGLELKGGIEPYIKYTETNLHTYEITVTPLAAGGTMPIYVAYHGPVTFEIDKLKAQFNPEETYNDYAVKLASFNQTTANWQEGTWIVGTELHKWLGASGTNQPINVGESVTHTGKSVKFYANADPDVYGTSHVGSANAPLCNFSVIVDKENTLGINTSAAFNPNGNKEEVVMNGLTKFTGTLGEGSYQIGAVSEDKNATAPQMIFVYDFSDRGKKWEWPKENTNIKLAYPKFADWVSNPNISWNYPGDGNDEHCTRR